MISFCRKAKVRYFGVESEVGVRMSGLSAKEMELLQAALPSLPDSYLLCAKEYDLLGLSYGFFNFSPIGFETNTLLDSLKLAATAANPYLEYFNSIEAHHVASWDVSPIGVMGAKSPAKGEVILLNVDCPPVTHWTLSSDFMTFMLAVFHLGEVQHVLDGNDALEEFRSRIAVLDPNQQFWDGWRVVAETTFL